MNLSQLEILVAIVDTGSLTEAAETVNITQSAVSHALNRLEAELGVTLLERGRQGVRVTRIGAEVVSHARLILGESELIRQKTSRERGLVVGKVRFGCVPHVSPRLLSGVMRDFQHQYPDAEVVLFEGTPAELAKWLQARMVDVATVLTPDVFPQAVPLAHEEVTALLAASHPLAGAQSISLAQLRNERLIAPREQYTMISKLPIMQGVRLPRLHHAVSTYSTIFAMVKENLGFSLIPSRLISPTTEGIVTVPLKPPIRMTVYLAARIDTPAIQVFMAHAQQWAKDEGYLDRTP